MNNYINEIMEEDEWFKSEEFKKKIQESINKNTWDKNLPKYYIDKDKNIIEHWKDGTINTIKKYGE